MVIIVETKSFWNEHLFEILGLSLLIVTFIIERVLNYLREQKSDRFQWFVTIIVEPHLQEIKEFYEETELELRNSQNTFEANSTSTNVNDYLIKKRIKIDTFKKRRKQFFNNFVAMVGSFDEEMALKVDEIINILDDCYVNAIDMEHSSVKHENFINKIYRNKADLYQTLFNRIA